MKDLDSLDTKLLNILRKNARISTRKLAKMLGVSPSTISRKIRNLEDKGYIIGYVAVLNDAKLGYLCNLLLMIKLNSPGVTENIVKKIVDMDASCMVSMTTGTYDIIALVRCKDPNELEHTLYDIGKLDGVERLDSLFIVRHGKFMNLPFI
jgi:DNA-binding Lrp family transcriptional regulator